MLPQSYRQGYEKFAIALELLLQAVTADNQEPGLVNERFQALKQVYAQNVAIFRGDELTSETFPRWQSFQTEIVRSQRLLEMDAMFLQASGNWATVLKRKNAMSDRISTLISYCEALLQAKSE
ncbi:MULTISPECIES: heterocyst frequency control protein PatD [Cyanophyceae]|uniref:heterocyst frequency control protein PatD n=1 Tax=Cyanophyceae TaxID=3028117 RepID=UPI00168707FE|nr:heterocyst frequency control protein PatD [Trichocoleus sp. FACHB-40]MBD2007095.1 heterocyst frequency control protein PatD [Trichocoleus sp. FACHB-40]